MAEPRKPVITTSGLNPELARVLEPIKQSMEMLTGSRSGVTEIKGAAKFSAKDGLSKETCDALNVLVRKINQIAARLNASGKA